MTFVKILLIFSVTIGAIEYYPRTISFTPSVLFGEASNWPSWKDEVNLWRMNKDYQPKVWPYIKKTNGIWPERNAVWSVDFNEPKSWNSFGRKTFSGELKKILSPERTE